MEAVQRCPDVLQTVVEATLVGQHQRQIAPHHGGLVGLIGALGVGQGAAVVPGRLVGLAHGVIDRTELGQRDGQIGDGIARQQVKR